MRDPRANPGHLSIVGIGPGSPEQMTGAARAAVPSARTASVMRRRVVMTVGRSYHTDVPGRREPDPRIARSPVQVPRSPA